jgi:tetratricopeptide (TPR) repeat protein
MGAWWLLGSVMNERPILPQPASAADRGLDEAHASYRAGRFEEAARIFEQEASQGRGSDSWFFAGLSRHMIGEYDHAVRLFRRSLEKEGKDPLAQYNIACGLARLGRNDEALDALERSVSLGFDRAAQITGDFDLVSLRDEPRFRRLIASLASPLDDDKAAAALLRLAGVWDSQPGTDEGMGRLVLRPAVGGFAIQFTMSDLMGEATEGILTYLEAAGEWRCLASTHEGAVLSWSGGPEASGEILLSGPSTDADGTSHQDRLIFRPGAEDRLVIIQERQAGPAWREVLKLDLVRTSD